MASTSSSTTTIPVPEFQAQGAPASGASGRRPGSLGPFFAVMSVLLILTVFSCVFGRVCASKAEAPDASYDCSRWTRRRWRWRRSFVSGESKAPPASIPSPDPQLQP
ncbi:uncharacterized protein LOC122036515 [Zingiber officinale]|uniref:uncharacterized protein LOC122036515 n=1 Tax=Zingiber officinale TaxID=94328 RepID=UPI001C4B73B3|nr:uncharacterized protein LOC122036515 [Zingiber officinale]